MEEIIMSSSMSLCEGVIVRDTEDDDIAENDNTHNGDEDDSEN